MAIPGMGGYAGMWQFDGCSMYPNSELGVQNDINIYKFTTGVERLENMAAQLQTVLPALMAQQNAALTAQWQNMAGLSASNAASLSNLNYSNLVTNPLLNNNTLPGNRIPEEEIAQTINMMMTSPTTDLKERMNKEVEIVINGEKKKVSIGKRLIELVNEYRRNPNDHKLSEEDFNKIWTITSTFALTTGKLSTKDYAILENIVKNSGTSTIEDSDNDDDNDRDVDNDNDNNNDEESNKIDRVGNYAIANQDMQTRKEVAELFKSALYRAWGTDCDKLQVACNNTDKYNIIEVLDEFEKNCGSEFNENLIQAILNDCSNWGTGRSHWWGTDDDARESIANLAETLTERATDVVKLAKRNNVTLAAGSNSDKTAVEEKVEALKNYIATLDSAGHENGSDLTEVEKSGLNQKFKDLINAIKAAESTLYPEEM